jgi:hypothetical protein
MFVWLVYTNFLLFVYFHFFVSILIQNLNKLAYFPKKKKKNLNNLVYLNFELKLRQKWK